VAKKIKFLTGNDKTKQRPPHKRTDHQKQQLIAMNMLGRAVRTTFCSPQNREMFVWQ
jgi:hypothetical protein